MQSAQSWPTGGLVLVAPGGVPLAPADRLAALLGLRTLPRPIAPAEDPAAVLRALELETPGWLLPLALDPGEQLAGAGCWADALGAWRQPVLLLTPAVATAAAPAGVARAYHALLQLTGVPLLGLIQSGGAWAPEQRRCDGLPWLGWLPASSASEAELALAATTAARWRAVSVARPDPLPLRPPGATDRQV
jgi:hypothetical protein